MKKPISIILKILSIISAAITLILAAFCAYDWIKIANTQFAYTVEFWLVVDYYAVAMLIFAGAGVALSLPNCFIADEGKPKKTALIMTIAFVAVVLVSLVLYLLPFNI